MTRAARGRRAIVASLAAMFAATVACSAPRDPILVDEGMITIENQTTSEWRNVRVTVNDHFGGGAPSLAAGGKLMAPLSELQTGLGQKFNRGRQSVFKVEVTATDSDGKAVSLKWGQDLKPKS